MSEFNDDNSTEEPAVAQTLSIDDVCIRLRGGDPYARATLEHHVKKLYRDNGALTCNTSALLPIDILKITDDELINVVDNMISQINRTKKGDMTVKIISAFTGSARLFSAITGVQGIDTQITRLSDDPILRSSIMETMVGKNISPKPLHTLGLCLLEYGTRIATALIIDGQRQQQFAGLFEERRGDAGGNSTTASSNSEHTPPESNPSHG